MAAAGSRCPPPWAPRWPPPATRTDAAKPDVHDPGIARACPARVHRPTVARDRPQPFVGDPAYDVRQHPSGGRVRLVADPVRPAHRPAGPPGPRHRARGAVAAPGRSGSRAALTQPLSLLLGAGVRPLDVCRCAVSRDRRLFTSASCASDLLLPGGRSGGAVGHQCQLRIAHLLIGVGAGSDVFTSASCALRLLVRGWSAGCGSPVPVAHRAPPDRCGVPD
jgi:hypothetical protein